MNDNDLPGFPPEAPLSSDELERVIRLRRGHDAREADPALRARERGTSAARPSGLMDRIEALVTDADHRPPLRKGAAGPGSLADES